MKARILANQKLLEEMKQFRQQCGRWLSEIDYWKVELMFFRRLLDIYTLKIFEEADKRTVNDLQRQLNHYMDETLQQYKSEIKSHEEYLNELIENKDFEDEYTFRKKQEDMERQIARYKKEYFRFKDDLYKYTENLRQ